MENSNSLKKSAWFTKSAGFSIAGFTALVVLIDLFSQRHYGLISPTWSNIFRLGFIIYYCMLIYRIHKIIAYHTGNAYAITPGKAVGFMFIPFYDLYWLFKWPLEASRFISSKKTETRISTGTIKTLLIVGLIAMIIPIPVNGNVFLVLGLSNFFLWLHISFSLLLDLQEINFDESVPQSPDVTTNEQVDFDVSQDEKATALLIAAVPGLYLLSFFMRILIHNFLIYRYSNFIMTLGYVVITILVARTIKNQNQKIIIFVLAGLMLFIAIGYMFHFFRLPPIFN